MAVRIRLKQLGRRHRPFYRICAMDAHRARGSRVIEELGTYDPMIRDTDARTVLNGERVKYWLSVGALPTDKVGVLIKKYGPGGTHLEKMDAARAKLSMPKVVGPAPELPPEKVKAPEAVAEGEAPAEGEAAPEAPAAE